MAINIIESHHNLERDVTDEILAGAPHVVRCRTCKVGPMTLEEAEQHTKNVDTVRTDTTFRLFTIFP